MQVFDPDCLIHQDLPCLNASSSGHVVVSALDFKCPEKFISNPLGTLIGTGSHMATEDLRNIRHAKVMSKSADDSRRVEYQILTNGCARRLRRQVQIE
ncbi:hypothetical protein D3C73_1502520 [compost metagenome]